LQWGQTGFATSFLVKVNIINLLKRKITAAPANNTGAVVLLFNEKELFGPSKKTSYLSAVTFGENYRLTMINREVF
jgi:hypothetical protein